MKHMRISLLILLFVSVGSSCAGRPDYDEDNPPPPSPAQISANDFRRDCVVDEDCVAVINNSVCGHCLCETSAINVADKPAHDAAVLEAQSHCSPLEPISGCGACEPESPACVEEECVLVAPGERPMVDGGN